MQSSIGRSIHLYLQDSTVVCLPKPDTSM